MCLLYFPWSRTVVVKGIGSLSLSDSVQCDLVTSVETLFELLQLLLPDHQIRCPLLCPDGSLRPCYGLGVLARPLLKKVEED